MRAWLIIDSIPDRARWIVELRVSEMGAYRAGCLRVFGSGVAEYMMLTVTRAQSAAERERSAVAWRLGQVYNTVSSWIMYPVCPVHIVEMCGAMFVVSGLLCFLERNLGTKRRQGESLASIAGKAARPRWPLPELRAHRAGWRLPSPATGLTPCAGSGMNLY